MFCILRRECVAILRQRKSLLRLGSILFVLSAFLVFGWQAMGHNVAGNRPPDMGRQIFAYLTFFQLLFLLSLAGSSAQAISLERERESWDLLMATPLGPWKILLGKLCSTLVFVLLAYTAFLPILALCFFLGGLSPHDMIGTYTILGGTAFLIATVGLLCSSFARHTTSALRATILLVILYSVLTLLARGLFVTFVLGERRFPAPEGELVLSPIGALISVFTNSFPLGGLPAWMQNNPHIPFLMGTALICLLLLVVTSRRIQKLETVAPAGPKPLKKRLRILGGEARRRKMKWGWSAVRTKEKVWQGVQRFTRPSVVRLVLLAMGGLAGLVICETGRRPPRSVTDVFSISSIITMIAICFLSVAAPAAVIAHERDRKTWDLLRASPLRSASITIGKALAAAEYVLGAGLFFFAGLYGAIQIVRVQSNMTLVSAEHLSNLASFTVLAVSCIALYVSAGVCFSAHAKSSAAAHSQTFGFIAMHAVGGFFLFAVWMIITVSVIGRPSLSLEPIIKAFLFLTPFGLLGDFGREWGFRGEGWATVVLAHSAILLGISALFLWAGGRRIGRPDI